MANPFLVLGGIAVGIVTATFGILQVPGWVASAQDASAKNDIAQISIAQAASLSTLGQTQPSLTSLNDDTLKIGVKVTTQASSSNVTIAESTDRKHYAIIVVSASGKAFWRFDGGTVTEVANRGAAVIAVNGAATAAGLTGAAWTAVT